MWAIKELCRAKMVRRCLGLQGRQSFDLKFSTPTLPSLNHGEVNKNKVTFFFSPLSFLFLSSQFYSLFSSLERKQTLSFLFLNYKFEVEWWRLALETQRMHAMMLGVTFSE